MYASSSAAEPAMYGIAAPSTRQVAAASGTSARAKTTSETAVAASVSRCRASRRFQSA